MSSNSKLKRDLRFPGAVLLGLGSIVGTGAFVSIGLAAHNAGSALPIAVGLGGLLAGANGLSSAQLAAVHPVSGGTYEYGYRFLTPWLGFAAGWFFLLAKSASAATALLGVSSYLLEPLGLSPIVRGIVAAGLGLGTTAVVASGLRRTTTVNAVIVSVAVGSLAVLVIAATPHVRVENLWPPALSGPEQWRGVLYASALMFVAYTGYGRLATLGEEVQDPLRTVPRAIVATLVLTVLLYLAVATVAVGTVGSDALGRAVSETGAPLELVASRATVPLLPAVLRIGAAVAMAGVSLNLILGLSRVALAMGRRSDLPASLGKLTAQQSPAAAVWGTGLVVSIMALTGDLRLAWSFSALTVLLYYSITNLAALRVPPSDRFIPRWISVAGLVGCLGLAVWVPGHVWLVGAATLGIGVLWRALLRRAAPHRPS